MILLFDVGNTNIHVSKSDGIAITHQYRVKSDVTLTVDELFAKLKEYLAKDPIEGVAISSVVPSITRVLILLSQTYLRQEPLVVKAGIKTGLQIKTDHPQEVGADLICAAVELTGKGHQVIVDLGTAIKYIYVNDRMMKGVIITPGVDISMKALVGNTALLPDINIEVPKKVLGTNTIECMQSGVTYGVAAQIEGLLKRIELEVNESFQVTLTGGISPVISPLIAYDHHLDDFTVLKGLLKIYNKNKELPDGL
jgi:type III pantothenate kinase